MKAIQEVSANGNFTMVFPAGVAIYTATDVIDITAQVKAALGIK